MSAKPKVYQGVKVRVTVKELLEQKRAFKAGKDFSGSQENKMQFSDPVPPPACYSACAPIMPTAGYPQTTPMPCYGVQEDSASLLDQLTLDHYHQPDTIVDNSFCDFQNVFPTFSEGSIQPFPIFHENMGCSDTSADTWHLSENYQGCSVRSIRSWDLALALHHCPEITPQSPSESSDRSNSFEYSPSCQGLEFIPQSYSSPSHADTRSCVYAAMDQHVYQHQDNSSFCYCAFCCSVDCQGSVREQDSYTNMDYMGYLTSTEDIFTEDLNSYDMCYI